MAASPRRLRLHRFAAVGVLLAALFGCRAAFEGYPPRANPPEATLASLAPVLDEQAVLDCLDQIGPAATTCRNRIVAGRMYAIDVNFSEFEKRLFRERRDVNFLGTLAVLGLTTGAAAVPAAAAKTALSAGAAGVTGAKAAFDREVVIDQSIAALHTQMRANRAQVAVRLRQGLREDADAYPLPLALADLEAFYNAGTILGALVGLNESAGVEARAAQAELDRLTSPFSADTATAALRQYWKPDGQTIDPRHQDEMRAWLARAGIAEPSLTFFFNSEQYAEARLRMARELGLVPRE